MQQISLIIPVYNSEKYLERCLDSVLAQTLPPSEIICVNDGSTDRSAEILERYAANDSRFKIIHQPNQGLAAARNTGLINIQGDYVCFLDSDDTLDLSFMKDLYDGITTTQADMVMTNVHVVNGDVSHDSKYKPQTLTSFRDKITCLSTGGCWNKIYNAQFLRTHQINFSLGAYFEDNPFTVQACFYSNKLVVVDGGKYNYILHKESITCDPAKSSKRRSDSLKIAQIIMDFARAQNCSRHEKQALINFCWGNFLSIQSYFCDSTFRKQARTILPRPPLSCILRVISQILERK